MRASITSSISLLCLAALASSALAASPRYVTQPRLATLVEPKWGELDHHDFYGRLTEHQRRQLAKNGGTLLRVESDRHYPVLDHAKEGFIATIPAGGRNFGEVFALFDTIEAIEHHGRETGHTLPWNHWSPRFPTYRPICSTAACVTGTQGPSTRKWVSRVPADQFGLTTSTSGGMNIYADGTIEYDETLKRDIGNIEQYAPIQAILEKMKAALREQLRHAKGNSPL